METVMMNPTVGQMVKNEEMGLTGVVIDVLDFQDVYGWMPASQLEAEGARLARELGSDYRRLFFEVVIDVLEADENAEFKPGEQANLSWEDFQHSSILQPGA